jgi:putative colanic acid biosynthesis acetyltransferase WcaF
VIDRSQRAATSDGAITDRGDVPSSVRPRNLRDFDRSGYDKGRSTLMQAAWFATLHLVFKKWWFPPKLRPSILRRFGARIGTGAVIRHGVIVQWPWKLSVGDHCWIGERSWFINLEPISIGNDVCISQGAVICSGSHVADDVRFRYDNAPIHIRDGAWIALGATVLRGVTVPAGHVVPAGTVLRSSPGV